MRTLAQFVAPIQCADLTSSLRVVMRGAPRIMAERHTVSEKTRLAVTYTCAGDGFALCDLEDQKTR